MLEERRSSMCYLVAILFGELLAVVLLRSGLSVFFSIGLASVIIGLASVIAALILLRRHLRHLCSELALVSSSVFRSIPGPSFRQFRFSLRRLLVVVAIVGVLLASMGYVASILRHWELYHTQIAESVAHLNGVAANDAIGKNQRPLSQREVIVALEEWLALAVPWVPEADPGKKVILQNKAKAYVKRIVDSDKLPRDFQIIWTGSVNSPDWSAQLNVVIPNHYAFGIPVRSVVKTDPPQ